MVTAYVDLYAGLTGAPSAGAASRQLRTAASGARA
jgi:hypothetical protein